MQLWKLLFFVPVIIVLAGCASKPTVSENQCRAGDWQTIGYRDGASGIRSTRLLAHQEACGEYGIVPQRSSYLAGWQEGVRTYCTANNGFQQGQRGTTFNTVCTDELREPYASAYDEGRQLYIARQEVNRLNNQINNHISRLDHIKQGMVSAATAQLSPALSVQERILLVAELEALADERADIKAELPLLEKKLVRAEQALDRVNESLLSVR